MRTSDVFRETTAFKSIMETEKMIDYVRRLQELRYDFISLVQPVIDSERLPVEDCLINFEEGIERALESVCQIYCEMMREEVSHAKG